MLLRIEHFEGSTRSASFGLAGKRPILGLHPVLKVSKIREVGLPLVETAGP
jgi:hypothetical protein